MTQPCSLVITKSRFLRAASFLLAAASCLVGASATYASTFDEIGLVELTELLGASVPTGQGVHVSLVEAPQGTAAEINAGLGRYYPDVSNSEFQSTLFTDGSGKQSNGISTHANIQAVNIFGKDTGIAPEAIQVTVYEANNWLQNVLKFRTSATPAAQDFRVQNHSWVGSFASSTLPEAEDGDNVRALQKLDFAIDRANGSDGMTAIVGLNNNLNAIPYLLAHSYNVISVGRTDGIHSTGLTQSPASFDYGPGRSKPDIVAPLATASKATSTVSGVATLLYEAVAGTNAENSETMKALLLAGATKDEFPLWSRSATQPLDDTYGAGEVNALNSYLIQLGGEFSAGESSPVQVAGSYGWDYENHKADLQVGDLYYRFEVPDDTVAKELSIVLAWNHPGLLSGGSNYDPAPDLQNLDLAFYDSSGGFLNALIDQSVSTVDNVEHISIRDNPATTAFEGLLPGTYTLKVSGAAGWDYGIAWRTTTQLASYNATAQILTPLINADFDDSGSVDGRDFLTWQRNAGRLVNASHAMGDADGDGDVDADDLLGFQAGYGPVSLASLVLAARAIPEPTGWLLACAAAAAWPRRRR